MPKQKTFSIIVPLFNEEENIRPLVESIIEILDDNPQFLELILVDDASSDSTVPLALEIMEQDQRVRLVQHQVNQGLGGAIRTGLSEAQGDFVLYTDADLPFDFKLIPLLLSKASETSVVSGYRLNRGEGIKRWILTKNYNFIIWLLFGLFMRDVNFACKIFPKDFLKKARFKSKGSFIDVEILLEARRFGLKIHECPLVYYPRERGISTLSRPMVIFYILKEMFNYLSNVNSKNKTVFRLVVFSVLAKFINNCLKTTASIYSNPGKNFLPQKNMDLVSIFDSETTLMSTEWRISLLFTTLVVIVAGMLLIWLF